MRPTAHWLDVGCGTRAVCDAICAGAQPAFVAACDPSESFVEYAYQHQLDRRSSFVVAGVGHLPTRPGGFDSVTCALASNFSPEPEAAFEEMHRIAATDGLVSACVWYHAGRMELLPRFRDSAAAVGLNASDLDEGGRVPICGPDVLVAQCRGAGLRHVACEAIEVAARFSTFSALWTPFLDGTGPAPSYVASLECRQREAVARHLEHSLSREPSGGTGRVATEWAVRGASSE